MRTRAQVDVIVTVYGNWSATKTCLTHLRDQTTPVHVIVVDNASPDDTADRVAAHFPDFTLLRLPVNRGYGAGCNAGIAAGEAPVVLILNNDVDAEPDLARRLSQAFEDEKVGSAAPLLFRPDGRVDSFGISADATGAGYVRYHGATADDVDAGSPEVLGPYGAAAAYRRAALDDVGTYDENIYMYGEELDLALRLRAGGWATSLVPQARGVHLGSATMGAGSPRQRYLAGFGRGYLLRVYGIIRSRSGPRAIVTEVVVGAIRAASSRDLLAARGRLAGWRAGRDVVRRTVPDEGIDRSIGLIKSLRMRSPRYWQRDRPTHAVVRR